jgi:hypothetical protein
VTVVAEEDGDFRDKIRSAHLLFARYQMLTQEQRSGQAAQAMLQEYTTFQQIMGCSSPVDDGQEPADALGGGENVAPSLTVGRGQGLIVRSGPPPSSSAHPGP